MHTTTVKMKNGMTISGILWLFRPAEGYFTLSCADVDGKQIDGDGDVAIKFDDVTSAITAGERIRYGVIGNEDELQRARDFMRDARVYGWSSGDVKVTPDWPVMEWEKV